MFKSVFSSSRDLLSPHTALEVASIHLENARQAKNPELALTLCNEAEAALSRIKRAAKKALISPPFSVEDQTLRVGIATAYFEHGKLVESLGYRTKAQASHKKAQKWGWLAQEPGQTSVSSEKGTSLPTTEPSAAQLLATLTPLPTQDGPGSDIRPMSPHIFAEDMHPPPEANKLPEPEDRLDDIRQLVYCLDLLRNSQSSDDTLDQPARRWLKAIKNDTEEQGRLKMLATNLLREFAREELKDAKAVAEVVYLVPILDKSDLQQLLQQFFHGIEQSDLLDFNLLEGLAQLIQGSPVDHLNADDLIKILELISTRLIGTHQQSSDYIYQLTLTVSHVLDAMADCKVKGLDRETLHVPLGSYLHGLEGDADPYLVYQAAYASQALLYVPDNETPWQATVRRAGKVAKGVSGLVSAVKGLDFNSFVAGLGNIQEGIAGATEIFSLAKSAYEDVSSLAESGKDFVDCLKEGLTFNRKRAWYSALRGADVLLRNGELTMFQRLVYEAPCRHDPAFQWGVCQRLGEIAANPECDDNSRKCAVAFLGEMYQNDAMWGQHANVKQWILNILMQLASMPGSANEAAETQLQELKKNGDAKKQALYQACRDEGPTLHPLKATLPELASPSLLDRVQNKPDVEGALRRLRNRRIKGQGEAVYIPPQAKPSLQARDDTLFPLMEKVKEFLSSSRKVLLLLGDSGAGKSTFNRALECDLWNAYTKQEGRIPLYISLPSIDKPEHDLIPKHLRKSGFSEAQIMELNTYRKFVLICDGYDESKQTHNLYTTNQLNQSGGWSAQMVISCRSEYLGRDYRDRFQPADRNKPGKPNMFQEAVVAPFTAEQVKDYIIQYVSSNSPQWGVKDYMEALKRIPSMEDLMTNPFLLTLALEVLPRMVNPGQNLSAARVTRVALYDQFVELWLERGKKRLGEKDLSYQEKKAFERLSDGGFTQNGISFLKKFAEAIYKEQGGHPVVEYAHFKDEGTWKDDFFCQDDVKDLLREACPLTRSGNQYRFIHRSLLEYGLARAVFEPQERGKDQKKTAEPTETVAPRRSVDSVWSFEIQGIVEEATVAISQEPDLMSPLVWRSFLNESSILKFLEERVQQEPLFKEQLLAFIEHSKIDKKWRIAAANAISILVRAGAQFTGMDLQGVQIPGADLSHGIFDSVQFQGADLRKVKLRNVWLRGACLDGAKMAGVQFGELPFLKEDGEVWCCSYSQDGKTLAVGTRQGSITIYKTSTWENIKLSSDGMGALRQVLYSSKGGQIASCSDDNIVRLWDVETGACRYTLTGHEEFVHHIAYSPNGVQLASGSQDCTVRLWDVETGVCRHTLTGHSQMLCYVAFSPTGDQIASCSHDQTVRLWDTETGDCLRTLTGHTDRVMGVVYSQKGDQIASRGGDGEVRLWDVGTGAERGTLRGHRNTVTAILYFPKGNQMATGSHDWTVRLWDLETGECRHVLAGHSSWVLALLLSPKGNQILSCSDDKTARLWDIETGDCLHILSGHNGPVWSGTYSPTGDHIATGSEDMTVRLWSAETSSPISQTLSSQAGAVQTVVYSPTGDQVISGSEDGTVRLWDVETGDCRHTLSGHIGFIKSIVYSPTGDHAASGGDDGTVRLWDVETGTCRFVLSGHSTAVLSVAYSPNGCQIASCSSDGTVRLWDVETGANSHTLNGHNDYVRSVAYSPRGDQIASGGDDGKVRLWNAETGDCLHILSVDSERVTHILYSAKGDQIATRVGYMTVWLWDLGTKACRHILAGHEMNISSVMYSPNGGQIATGSWDTTVRLWDVETGDCLHTLAGHHTEWIRGIAYSSKGNQIASCASDNTVQIWDVASGQHLAVVQNHVEVSSIAWNEISGGSYLVVGCASGSILMWQIVKKENECSARLRWRYLADVLAVADTSFQDTHGLSPQDKQLLKQRGAVGEPTPPISFRETGKRVASMLSAASKLRLTSNPRISELDASRVASSSAGQSEKPM